MGSYKPYKAITLRKIHLGKIFTKATNGNLNGQMGMTNQDLIDYMEKNKSSLVKK